MKIIKSFLLLTITISATTLLHAQELKTAVAEQKEIKALPAASSKPSPAPEFKPMNGAVAKEAAVANAETPSPANKADNKIQEEDIKTQVLTIDKNGANKLSAAQMKILNGNTERPKGPAQGPGTLDPNVRPAPVTKSTAVTQQQ